MMIQRKFCSFLFVCPRVQWGGAYRPPASSLLVGADGGAGLLPRFCKAYSHRPWYATVSFRLYGPVRILQHDVHIHASLTKGRGWIDGGRPVK